jgi:ribosomal protein S10
MEKISIEKMKALAKKYKLYPAKVKGQEVIMIRKHLGDNHEDVTWEEFERIMKKRKLAIYKATESDFVKLMKDKK